MTSRKGGRRGASASRASLWVASLFLCALALLGGSSRVDELAQPLVRLAAVTALVAALWLPQRRHGSQPRTPAIALAALAVLVGVQLLPMPPALWEALPGRGPWADTARAAGLAQPWRPLTLTPDLTWNTLLSLLPPAAALAVLSRLERRHDRSIVTALLVMCGISAVLAFAQLHGGSDTPLRYYAISTPDGAVGLFANRNHQGLLMALAVPLLAWWGRIGVRSGGNDWARVASALGLTMVAFLVVLVTGSRAALGSLAITGLGAALLWRDQVMRVHPVAWRRMRLGLTLAALALIGAIVAATIASGQAETIERLASSSLEGDARGQVLAPLLRMIVDFAPFGSGFGSFSEVYKHYEPLTLLDQNYMNHAHMDYLQVALEGGLPGVAIMAVALWWTGAAIARAWARPDALDRTGRLASIMALAIISASAFDYPLRTPFFASLLVLLAIWLRDDERSAVD